MVTYVAGQTGFPREAFDDDVDVADVDVAWLTDEEQAAWRTMVAVHARLVSRLDAELHAAHSISLRDYEVLVQLSEADGAALRMAELADRLFVSPSGLTRRLDGLVRDGLVKRQACLSDRRGTLAVLSTAGRAVLENAAPTHVSGVRRYVFDPLDRAQLSQLTSSLGSMSAALEANGRSDPDDTSASANPPRHRTQLAPPARPPVTTKDGARPILGAPHD